MFGNLNLRHRCPVGIVTLLTPTLAVEAGDRPLPREVTSWADGDLRVTREGIG
jgi:hypothetical protein